MAAGLVTALPIGPTNLWLAQAALPPAKPQKNIFAFVVGLIFLDAFYATLAFWGYSHLLKDSSYLPFVGIAAGLGLIAIGVHGALAARLSAGPEVTKCSVESGSWLRDLLIGLCIGSNPMYIAYWIGVARMSEAYVSESLAAWGSYVIFAGIVAGDILWYALFLAVLRRFAPKVNMTYARRSRYVIAVVFLAFGVMVLREFLP
jgi:threonine/homoserine/homoserine lactone efflux protein